MHQIQSLSRKMDFYNPFGMLFITTRRAIKKCSTAQDSNFITSNRSRCNYFPACSLTLMCLLGTPGMEAVAENSDNSRIRYQMDYSGNWEATDQYDLENLIELHIRIEDFLIPDTGYAELLFALAPGETRDFLGKGETDALYRGTTTFGSELVRKGIRKRSLGRGLEAVIYGWPKTADNNTDSVLLIDEIELVGRKERISLQLFDLKKEKKPKDKSEKKDKSKKSEAQ